MSLASKSKSASVAKPKAAAPKEDPKVKALEAKVAALEAKLTSLTEALAQLKSAPAPVAAAPSGRDDQLRSELKKYFSTRDNGKVRTHIPNLD